MVNYSDYVTFVCRKPGYGYNEHNDLINTFPVMEGTDKYKDRLKTAIDWASYSKDEDVNIIEKVPNLFKQGTVKIFDIEERGHGGRAWKISVAYKENEYVLDLREDVLLEIMKNYGISKGGIINTDLVLIFGGGYKVMIATDEYINAIKESDNEQKSLKKINLKNLLPYKVYESKTRDIMYLGRYYRISLQDILDENLVCKPASVILRYYSSDDYKSVHEYRKVESVSDITVYKEKDIQTYLSDSSKSEQLLFLLDMINKHNKDMCSDCIYGVKDLFLKNTYYVSIHKNLSIDNAIEALEILKKGLEKLNRGYYFISNISSWDLNELKNKINEQLENYEKLKKEEEKLKDKIE